MQEVRHVDFTSSATRKKQLESAVEGLSVDDLGAPGPSATLLERLPTQAELHAHLQKLATVSPLAAVLSHHKDFCKPWVTEVSTPLDLSKLYDQSKEGLSYDQLLIVCREVLEKMEVTLAEIRYIEKATRKQADSVL